jgi:hypothetical protein
MFVSNAITQSSSRDRSFHVLERDGRPANRPRRPSGKKRIEGLATPGGEGSASLDHDDLDPTPGERPQLRQGCHCRLIYGFLEPKGIHRVFIVPPELARRKLDHWLHWMRWFY